MNNLHFLKIGSDIAFYRPSSATAQIFICIREKAEEPLEGRIEKWSERQIEA